MSDEAKVREAFEEWAENEGHLLDRIPDDGDGSGGVAWHYAFSMTRRVWAAYRHATACVREDDEHGMRSLLGEIATLTGSHIPQRGGETRVSCAIAHLTRWVMEAEARAREESRQMIRKQRERIAALVAEVERLWGLLEDLTDAIGAHFDPPDGRRKTWPGSVYMAHRAADAALRGGKE